MSFMVVTLEVSRLSGWLNADAPLNMKLMSVTPEVSQLEMSASKFCKFEKSPLKSVTLETSQSAIWPKYPMAAGLSLLNSETAKRSVYLFVKT